VQLLNTYRLRGLEAETGENNQFLYIGRCLLPCNLDGGLNFNSQCFLPVVLSSGL